VGYGGHAAAILPCLQPGGRLLGFDRDPEALRAAGERLRDLASEPGWPATVFLLRQANYRHLPALLTELQIPSLDGLFLDLGVSSPQLDEARRGFSFRRAGPLDMRMNPADSLTAADLVNGASEAKLARLLWEYGEERYSRRIARRLVARRAERPFETTDDLAAAVVSALPPPARHRRAHAATRTFQALRIAVNGELEALRELLDALPDLLAPGGRCVILSYHSLEDRLVKRAFRRLSGRCVCPPGTPICQCGARPILRILTRKPIGPGEAEIAANPRVRGAKLRAAERLPD